MNKFDKIAARLNKPCYKHLTGNEKKLYKLIEKKNQLEKDLYGINGFYAKCPRESNGIVAWTKLTDAEMDFFEQIQKSYDKTIEKINNAESKFNLVSDDVMIKFNQTQNSLSQSF